MSLAPAASGRLLSKMKVLKKVVISSIMMIVATSFGFACLCAMLLYAARSDTVEIRDRVIGEWKAIQYYHDGVKYVSSQGYPVYVELTDGSITIESQNLPGIDHQPCSWSNRSVRFRSENEDIVSSMYFDEDEYLHMIINAWTLELVLIENNEPRGMSQSGGK